MAGAGNQSLRLIVATVYRMNLQALENLYRTTLLADVIPFWMRHGPDLAGGLNTCIRDDGSSISRDKWVWSQWRAVWVFSALHNRIEARPEWLGLARDLCRFLAEHGPLDNGHWPLLLDANGNVLRGYESVYVDGFALYALAELFRATGDSAVRELAMRTFAAVREALGASQPPPAWPYPIAPGQRTHGISMIFSLALHDLAEATGEAEVRVAALAQHRAVMETFLRPERGLVLERMRQDGAEAPPPQGTAVVPGHAIESMWFQIHIAQSRNDSATIATAVAAIRRHLEAGWDGEYGGILHAIDADGRPDPAWGFADAKLWWPHTEALCATLLAYEHCREDWCLQWHERIREYSFAHYPVPEHGEWRQKLDRRGQPMEEVVALPVKDPFHLPRALILCLESLRRLRTKP